MLRPAAAVDMVVDMAVDMAEEAAAAAMDPLSPAEAVASPVEEAMDLLHRKEEAALDLLNSSSSSSTAEIGAGKPRRMSAPLRNHQVSQIHPQTGKKNPICTVYSPLDA